MDNDDRAKLLLEINSLEVEGFESAEGAAESEEEDDDQAEAKSA